jgi:hypothetical protein
MPQKAWKKRSRRGVVLFIVGVLVGPGGVSIWAR